MERPPLPSPSQAPPSLVRPSSSAAVVAVVSGPPNKKQDVLFFILVFIWLYSSKHPLLPPAANPPKFSSLFASSHRPPSARQAGRQASKGGPSQWLAHSPAAAAFADYRDRLLLGDRAENALSHPKYSASAAERVSRASPSPLPSSKSQKCVPLEVPSRNTRFLTSTKLQSAIMNSSRLRDLNLPRSRALMSRLFQRDSRYCESSSVLSLEAEACANSKKSQGLRTQAAPSEASRTTLFIFLDHKLPRCRVAVNDFSRDALAQLTPESLILNTMMRITGSGTYEHVLCECTCLEIFWDMVNP